MTHQIRHSVFETNSSSSHSITISNNKKLLTGEISVPGTKLVLGSYDFEKDINSNDPRTKAEYIAETIRESIDEIQKHPDTLKYTPSLVSMELGDAIRFLNKTLIEVIETQQTLPPETVEVMDNPDSYDSLNDWHIIPWLVSSEKIREFIYNPNVSLQVDYCGY